MSDQHASRAYPDDTDPAPPARPVTLTELLAVPRHRWRWLVLFAALGAVAVLGYLTVLPASYTATSVVTVRPVVTDPFTYPGPGADRAVNMNVEQGTATGDRVIHAVAAATGRDADQVRDRLTVEVPVGGQLLRFDYTADTGTHAVTGANTAAKAYLKTRRDHYAAQRDARLHSYDKSLSELAKKESAAERRATRQSSGTTTAGTPAADRVRALDDQISQLTGQRAQIAAVDLTPGTLTSPAGRPVPSNRDHAVLYLLAGVLGGALLGAVAGYARESADRRVRRAVDAATAADAPLLGEIRGGRGRSDKTQRADVAYLALAVTALTDDRLRQPVMLLSARGDEGRADLSADLAVALAQQGEHVYLGEVLGAGDRLHGRVMARLAARPGTGAPATAPADGERRTAPDPRGTAPGSRGTGPDLTDTAQLPAVRLAVDGQQRPTRAAVAVVDTAPRRVVTTYAARGDDTLARAPIPVVSVGDGSISVGPASSAPTSGLVVLDAPPADLDPRGLRALRDGLAVLVAARDRTRVSELRRLADRLRTAGNPPAGVVLTGGRRA